jgi:hypothetical protein
MAFSFPTLPISPFSLLATLARIPFLAIVLGFTDRNGDGFESEQSKVSGRA